MVVRLLEFRKVLSALVVGIGADIVNYLLRRDIDPVQTDVSGKPLQGMRRKQHVLVVLLLGGGALLGGLPELISDNVGAPCFVADNPIECVARGVDAAFKMSGELLDGFEQIQLYNFR